MKRFGIAVLLLASAGLIFYAGAATAGDDHKHDEKGMGMKMPETMNPGKHHAAFKKMAGDYNVDMKFWMPGQEKANEAKATASWKAIMGGRFGEEHFKANVMGHEMQGRYILGYNNIKKRYEGVWIDNHSTQMWLMHGNKDEKGTLTMTGEGYDEMFSKNVTLKSTVEGRKDGAVMTMWKKYEGVEKWMKVFVMTYTRAGGDAGCGAGCGGCGCGAN